jgi:Fe-S-cluster-containing dehydrogenase component/anaerobic selenocysteine-containing dehydrogenase
VRSASLVVLSPAPPPSRPRYWRSLAEREGLPEAGDETALQAAGSHHHGDGHDHDHDHDEEHHHRGSGTPEFPPGADVLEGVSRRDFVSLLGATLAVGGTACYRPKQKIVPYVRRPPEVTPGNPQHFATTYALEGYGLGLLVESHAGRPTKVEGNPDHPDSMGATSMFEQALTMGLYDDDRAKSLRHGGSGIAWRALLAVLAQHGERLGADGGAKLRFLVEPSGSPLLADLRARVLQRFPRARFVAHSSVAADGVVDGTNLAFGRPLEPRHNLAAARVIVALDSDFMSEGPEQVRLSRQFSGGREPGPNMNRLYVAEPCPTPTGTMADHRLRVRGSDILALVQALVARLGPGAGGEAMARLAALPAAQTSVDARWVDAVAKELLANRGRSVVLAGRRQPAAVHALVDAINVALGNVGTTVSYWAAWSPDPRSGIEPMRTLVEEIAAGQIDTLVITAENPVYGAPVDFKLDRLLPRVPHVIYMGTHEDETAAVAETFIPKAHVLEAWGDAEALDGTVSLVQPLIYPLWNGRTEADLLAAFLGEGDRGAHALLKALWLRRAVAEGRATAESFEAAWENWLAVGVIEKTGGQPESPSPVAAEELAARLEPAIQALPRGTELEVGFAVDSKVFDGRFANNPWLQELPHPITKMTWDNAVLLSPATARGLKIEDGDVVEVSLGDRKVNGPALIQPGHADNAVTLSLGYGRTFGRVATGVGFNAGLLRTSKAPWFELGGTLRRTGGRHRFGITQVHWKMEQRDPVLEANLADFVKKDSRISHELQTERGPLPTIHKPVDYSGQQYKWAMSIDLNKCTGCSVCVIACVAENNIPVVGRDNVRIGREMQWIRVDRYYKDGSDGHHGEDHGAGQAAAAAGAGTPDDPQFLTQPVMCVHCETAPCEYVCPVNATTHSDEGLNEMVYNRCVGTRYCSNNCPYKVRRFNFLDYYPSTTSVEKMAANPDVTVRSRGIMEKCTYCVQRIERTRIDARIEGRTIRDGEILVACQQACPSGCIEFGSLNDPNSKVSKKHEDSRRYDLLHELGTRPRTAYLARVRNPNPELG